MHGWLASKWGTRLLAILGICVLFFCGIALGYGINSGKAQQTTKPAVVSSPPAASANVVSTPQPAPVIVTVNPPVVNVTVIQTVNGVATENPLSSTVPSCQSGINFEDLKGFVYNGNFNSHCEGVLDDGSSLDHSWGSGGPFGFTCFSVKWRGSVVVSESGRYQFNVLADDRVQLYVDGKCRIDKWISGQPITTYTVSMDLTAGQHTIILRYFNDIVGDSRIRLSCQRIG